MENRLALIALCIRLSFSLPIDMFEPKQIQAENTLRKSRSFLFLILILFTSITSLLADKSILDESLASIQSKALNGDTHYQGALGLFYKTGELGLPIDLEEATRWVKLAANNEGALGLATLAAIELEKGNTERGQFLYDEAYLHSNLRKLGKQKDPMALYCLGMMEMDNPPRNIPKAIRSLEESAEMGFCTAQATLGMIYFAGIGVKKDSNTAIKWSSMAAQKKIPLGMFYLGLAYSVGDGMERNEDFSIRWIKAAADRELTMAQLTLGMKLALGDGIEKDLELAVQWLRRATLNGSAEAALQLRKFENILLRLDSTPLAQLQSKGNQSINQIASSALTSTLKVDNRDRSLSVNSEPSTRPDMPENFNSYLASNEIDTVDLAKQSIALDGNQNQAIILLGDAAETGDYEAMNELGLLYYKDKEFRAAKTWFEKAAQSNYPESLRYLGIIHFLGQGVEINYAEAGKWLDKAVKAGDLEATRYLRIVLQFR